ncbi:protein FAR1-RELATED SEQUENCE 9-like [Salvia splendens]|uniref:protein FAR1-RELATED SEQUENCE 9-like n=1 Tax=Salvia splendens TaxID=180675 RepID=UPI001C26D7F5|nr:protein FAR1-RELATED SEQUENCE 9-like [Salvia splendens]
MVDEMNEKEIGDILISIIPYAVNPDCRPYMKPYISQVFETLDEGISFYEAYANECRFDTRRFGHKYSNGVKTWQTIYSTDPGSPCYVVSNLVDQHNHEMVDKKHVQYMKSNRILGDIHYKFMQDCSKANIGPTMTFNLLKEFLGGYDAVGCTVTDIRNGKRDILYCMVFGPFTGKDNHGCPITFGAGFVSNEGADTFSWLLSELSILPEKVPKRILANEELKKDLDSCIRSELLEPEEFEETWLTIVDQYGLQNKFWFTTMFTQREYWIPAYFRDFPMGSLLKTPSFSESENSFFKSALDAQRSITERLDFSYASKVPILSTELFFEKHSAAMCTDRIFQQVQEEIVEAHRRCRMSHFEMEYNTEIYTIMDNHRNKGVVRHEVGTESYHCDCMLFLRRGILCSHIFWLFKNHDVKEIPGTYIGTRWLKTPLLKSVHNDPSEEASTSADSQVDDKRVAATKLHSLYFYLFQRAQSNGDDIFALFDGMEKLSHKLFGDTVPSVSSIGKAQMIENLYGLTRPNVVSVHPPNVVSTKGSCSTSGRRIQSSVEKAIILQNKPKR